MKTATITIHIIGIECPLCGESHAAERTGTFDHDGSSLSEDGLRAGKAIKCGECGERFRLPAIISRVGI